MLKLDFLPLCYWMEQRVLLDQHKTEFALDLHSLVPLVPFVVTPQRIFLPAPFLYQLLLILSSHLLSAFSGFLLLLFFSLLLQFSSWPLPILFFFLPLMISTTLLILRLIYVPLLVFSWHPPILSSSVARQPFPFRQQ